MEINVDYIRISRQNSNHCEEFLNLGYAYMKEVAPDKSLEIHNKFLNSILNRQSETERWLVGIKINAYMVGFAHLKVDRSERVGWGYIMEFYIVPDFRRKGLGRMLYGFIEEEFKKCGIHNIWLNANRENGEPFWCSLGFMDTGEIEHGMKILEISL